MRFQDLPIKRKLMLAILLTSTMALLLVCGAAVVYEVAHYRQTAVNDLYMQALTMGENSATAIAFDDRSAAQRYLGVLRFRPDIVQACLYATDGTVIAEYNPANSVVPRIPAHPENRGSEFQGTYLSLFHRLKLGNDPAGTIFLRADLRGERARLASYVCIVVIVALISLLVSMLLSRKLQRLIVEPALDLARATRKVTEANDYSIRATKHSQDEIGVLTDGFNEMLMRIEQRDQELHNSEQRFRQLAETISEVFWMTNVGKNEMIYVSPAYEEIWGRTCASLYAAPKTWIDAIHPEDRERIAQAAMVKQAGGHYDEEYRIVRPSGSIRWIRDRAFPILDIKGTVYRIAGIAQDITERKLAESQLATLAHAVESTSELICITDLQDRFVFANGAFLKAYGYSKEEILGRTPEILFSSHNPPSLVAKVLEQTRLGGWQGEVLDRRKDGTEFPIRLSTSLVKDRNNHVLGLIGIARDITDWKLAQDALRKSEEKYRGLFETSRDAIMISEGPFWKFTAGNSATVKMFGAKNEEQFISHTPWELSPERQPDGRNSAEKAMEMIRAAVREGSYFFEWTHRRIGGEEFPATVLLTKMERDGNVVLQATVRDITERKRHEEQLRLQGLALEAAANSIAITDCQGTILWVNPAFTKLTGYTADEVIGMNPRVLKSGRHDKTFYQDLWQTILSGQVWRGEMVNKRKDGSLYTEEMTITPVRDGAGGISRFIAIKQDVTERKRLEKEVLEISDREQARLGQDLHDGLCQQLVRTTFACKILEQEIGDQPRSRQDRARKITALLDDAITQTRNIARGLYPVQLDGEGFDSVLKDLCADISERWALSCVLICSDPVTIPNKTLAMHLYRIAQEGITNAVKHAKCTHVVVELASDDAAILLTVTDDGVGIENTEQLRQGMGFHIMMYRAKLIGASLEIKKGPSGGTIVCCSLPK